MGLSRRPWIHIHLINDKTDFWVDPVAQMVAGMLTVILFPALRHIAVSISAISFDSLWHKNPCNYRARRSLERHRFSKWILLILSGFLSLKVSVFVWILLCSQTNIVYCSLLTGVRFSRLFYTIDSIKSHDREKLEAQGDYFEACNCDTVCPCVFLGNPDQGECDVNIAWHIDKGHFDDTSLDGLNVVAVFHTPGSMFTGPKWKAALYLDE